MQIQAISGIFRRNHAIAANVMHGCQEVQFPMHGRAKVISLLGMLVPFAIGG